MIFPTSRSARRGWARRLWRVALAVLGSYCVLLAGLFAAMCLPPGPFGQFMKFVPMQAMTVVPFEPMWNVARAGAARVGEMAPEFTLPTVDRKSTVRLASFRGKQPVVLVFGSYT